MKKALLLIFFVAMATSAGAQKMAVKTNLVGWGAAVTTNLGVEVAMGQKFTFAFDGYYNPFTWPDRENSFASKPTKGWAAQPELKYWFCNKFFRSYLGVHGIYSQYNCGWNYYIYDGKAWGAGLSYGYNFVLSKRWRLDLSVGAGWQHWDYNQYDRLHNYEGDVIMYDPVKKDMFGLTKASLSFVFIIF